MLRFIEYILKTYFIGDIGEMGTFNSLEEAREYFKNDRFATTNGM